MAYTTTMLLQFLLQYHDFYVHCRNGIRIQLYFPFVLISKKLLHTALEGQVKSKKKGKKRSKEERMKRGCEIRWYNEDEGSHDNTTAMGLHILVDVTVKQYTIQLNRSPLRSETEVYW